MLTTEFPTRPEDLSVDVLNRVIAVQRPDVALSDFQVIETHVWGEGEASSAGRIIIEPEYSRSSPHGLPARIVIKVAKSAPGQQHDPNSGSSGSGQLYANEVNVYNRLRPAEFLEAPQSLGGAFDPRTKTFVLLLEDLRERGGIFASIKTPTGKARMQSLIGQLASLHARYWNSPELSSSLDWMESHTEGALHDLFTSPHLLGFAEHQVSTEQFKREMLERLGVTPRQLSEQFKAIQRHQARLPQTVCHGDSHIGNTYILPDDHIGLLDWQLTSKGFAMHDISYALATGLSVAERRAHEHDLVAEYREQLLAQGVADAPSFDQLWLEYRRAMVWGVYIGWLITPVVNYGWETTVMAHLRMMTAYEDLESNAALAELV